MLNQKNVGLQNLPVDLIRAVAIVLVILLHAANESHVVTNIMAPEEIQRWWASNVYMSLASPCIALFVMLSSVLLLQPSKFNEPLRVFFRKRWARIGLPFIFWTIIYFAWAFLVDGEAFTSNAVIKGILQGPYVHFWYLYLLIGLFLITPIFRVIIAHSDWKTLKYTALLLFAGTAITYLFFLLGPLSLNANVFLLTGWLGYYFAGICLMNVRVRRSILYSVVVFGYLWAILGTYLLVGAMGEQFSHFFYDSFSINVIGISVALFLLLSSIPSQRITNRLPRGGALVRLISLNTLPIYLFHIIVLETLQRGYLGFKISITTMNPFLEVPLITVITLFICLGVLVAVKKIPHLARIIG